MTMPNAIAPILRAGAVAGVLMLGGCAAYGYGPGYAYGYGPDYYGYAPGYAGGVFVGGGGPFFVGRDRIVRREVRVGHRVAPRFGARAGSFAAAHGGIGKFGMRVGGGHFGGARIAHGGIGHFGARER